MGLFDSIFRKPNINRQLDGFWKTMTAYSPAFTSWSGGLYESELVRAAINARATHASKLEVQCYGSAQPSLQSKLRQAPNAWQTWSQFLYRVSTILDINNNCFIVPVCNEFGETIGIYPILPSRCEILQYQGEPWIKYEFRTGQTATIAMSECGILTKFQYEDDVFGSDNSALGSTMKLVDIQNQGIAEGIKSAATFRFMAQYDNFAKAEDLAKERKRFTQNNLESDGGGLLLFPNTYKSIQQINSKPFVVDAEQMNLIQQRVNNYFGVNAAILQNEAVGDKWSAFYEGAIEPLAIQLSEVLTKMLFTPSEISRGSGIMATANRLQYMSNKDKLDYAAQTSDRGIMTINEIRKMMQLPPVEGGDVRTIRGEYKTTNEIKGEE